MSLTVFVTLAQFLKRSPEAAGIKPYGDDDVSGNNNSVIAPANEFNLKQALASSQFWLFGAGLVCLYFIGQTVLSQIAPHVVDIGLSRNLSAVILSVYAATSLAGTLLSGILTERIGIKKTIMVGFGIIFVMLVWLLFSNKEWMFYVFAVVFGTGFGIMIPLQTAAPGELFGLKSLGTISAALNVIGALGGATGPPLAGAIFDARGSYQLAFIIAIGMGCVAIILAFILNKVTVQKVRGN
jgi:MFS family permease